MKKNRRQLMTGAGVWAGAFGLKATAQQRENIAVKPSRAATGIAKFLAAATSGDVASVKRWLDDDPALLYARDQDGNSVFTLASLAEQTKVTGELAHRGLVLDIFEAAASGNIKRATEISQSVSGIAHLRSTGGRTPMHFAATAGKPEMVGFLNANGADLSAGPESPLLAAVDHPDVAVAEQMAGLLLGNGSDPNAKRKDGKTALHLAAARGYGGLVRQLIHRGAAVDAKDQDGRSPLEVATRDAVAVLKEASNIDRVHFARRYSRDIHDKPVTREDRYGLPQEFINQFVTVAHFDFPKVKQLYGMCPTLLMSRATWDELAVEAAAHMGLVPMAQYLADLGSPVSTCTAAVLGLTGRVKAMISADPDCVRERGAHDLPLLAYTAFGTERTEVADFLLKSGANVDVRAFRQTTLHIAASKGHLDLAALLLDRGADVNALVKSRGADLTPLALAIQSKQARMEALLKERGGKLSI